MYPSIGILGAGAIGSAFATALARANIPALIANSRGPGSLASLASQLGPTIKPANVAEAARQDIVFVAIPWSKLPSALSGLEFGSRIVIDANNPIEAPLFRPAELHGRISSKVFSDLYRERSS